MKTPDETLARWLAEEEAVRERLAPETGVARREHFAGKPGMALFEALFAGQVPRVPIGQTLDFLPVHIEPGHAVFQGRPGPQHYNPMGSVHGGWFATLLDSALGCAVHSALPAGKGYTTLELKVNMIRALSDKVARVRAEGRLIHLGGQTATADARLVGPDGRLYAHGSTTCLVFDMPA
ncbi:PaaI family thioesterase [Rubrivivax sp. A210]|uniref:PaaI family thioesterase n=1 Tax=Rubrivivax sp. A210 TaxID=2772301 RepID=UPI00191AC73D|nr:PaaI family thioesterase [Rubrivivax sp. A210]CAD5374618.1 PaaI family thioesterase [Rubrivivax sp. A210]